MSFAGNEPAAVNSYNTLLAGTFKLDAPLPDTIGVINTTSCDEIYEYFLAAKREESSATHLKLGRKMLVDVNKNLVPLICAASTKEAAVAYKSALMKRVYVDEAKYGKFAAKVREDGQVELIAVTQRDSTSLLLTTASLRVRDVLPRRPDDDGGVARVVEACVRTYERYAMFYVSLASSARVIASSPGRRAAIPRGFRETFLPRRVRRCAR